MKLLPPSTAQLANLHHFRRPKIDVGNGDGFIEVAEVSNEHPGGDWSDIGYFFNDEDARAFAAMPQVLQVLASVYDLLRDEAQSHPTPEWDHAVRQTRTALLEAGYTITES
jgi:hypothetical protein